MRKPLSFEEETGIQSNTYDVSPIGDAPIGDDPFNNTVYLGWELLDDGNVIRAWNNRDSYYFNNSNGVQFSNRWNEYWSTNVLMIGYYSGEDWNLIYRTDELSGFNKDFEGETDNFMNLTLWKDLSFGSYDFRLALRYHLKSNDSDLTVIPYIKNLGINIPFDIGFGWELKDIQVGNTVVNDNIRVNETSYRLNQSLDNKYTNLSYRYTHTIMEVDEDGNWTGNYTTKNQTIYNTRFTLFDDTKSIREILYMRWDRNLSYLLQVKSRSGQVNAPVTLFIKVGTLDVNQEKSTLLNWYDAIGDYPTIRDDWEYAIGATATSVVVDKPSGTVENDLLVAFVATDGVETFIAPSGWTGIAEVESDACSLASFYKVATSSEPSDYTFTWFTSEDAVGSIIRITGADTTSPIHANTTDFESATGQPVVAPDITTSVDNCVILRVHVLDDNDELDDYDGYPPGHVGIFAKTDTTCSHSVAYENLSGQGSAGTATWSFDNAEEWVTFSIAVAPASATVPSQSNEAPTNGSTNVAVSPSLYVVCNDINNETMRAIWRSNSSGSWVTFASNTSIATGTNITQTNNNLSSGSEEYFWSVNLTDDYSDTSWTNNTYWFDTVLSIPEIQIVQIINGSTGVSTSPTMQIKPWDNGSIAETMTVKWYEGNTSDFILEDEQDDGGSYHDVWGNENYIYGNYIYACEGATDYIYAYTFDGDSFTLVKSIDTGGDQPYGIWGDDTYIYIASYQRMITAYTFNENGTEEFWKKDNYDDGGVCEDVWGDGTYIYTVNYNEGISAYTFNENATEEFWLKASQDDGGGYYGIWGNDTYIYCGCFTEGIRAYTFDGSSFTLKDTQDDGTYRRVWCDDDYIYSGGHAYTFDGSSFTLKDTIDELLWAGVFSDGTYIYFSANDGIGAYTFDGTSFTLMATRDDLVLNGGFGIYANDSYVYVVNYDSGIIAYSFNPWVQKNVSVSSGSQVEWTYTNASEGSTEYWWKVVVNNSQQTNGSVDWYSFTTEAGEEVEEWNINITGYLTGGNDTLLWTVSTPGYLTGGNDTLAWTIDTPGWLSGGNDTLDWSNSVTGYLLGGNTSSYATDIIGYLTGGNDTLDWDISIPGWLTGGNDTLEWEISTTGYLTGGNDTVSYSVDTTGYLTGGNDTLSWTIDIPGWLTGGNDTLLWALDIPGWLSGGNETSATIWNLSKTGFLTGGNDTLAWTIDTPGWLSGGNDTLEWSIPVTGYLLGGSDLLAYNTVNTGWLSGGNDTVWSNSVTGYLTGGNDTLDWDISIPGWLSGGNETIATIWNLTKTGYLTGGNDTYLSCSFTYTVRGSIVTTTPTITESIRYKWVIEDNAETEWIPIADIHNYQVMLPDNGNYKITLIAEDSTTSVSFMQIVTIKISVTDDEKEPDPIEKPKKPRVRNIFEDTGMADWFENRNIGELVLIGIIGICAFVMLFRRRPKKLLVYPTLKKKR